MSENVPTNKELYNRVKAEAKKKFDGKKPINVSTEKKSMFEEGYARTMKVADIFLDTDTERAYDAMQLGAATSGLTGLALSAPFIADIDRGALRDASENMESGIELDPFYERVQELDAPNIPGAAYAQGDYAVLPPGFAKQHLPQELQDAGLESMLFTPEGTGNTRSYSPAIVLHEMGHLRNSKTPVVRRLQNVGYGGKVLRGLAGAGLALPVAMLENEEHAQYAPAVAAAPMVPTLMEEARATWNADKLLQKLRNVGEAGDLTRSRLLRRLAPGYATYLAATAAPAAGAFAMKKYLDQERDTVLDDIKGWFR